jgi:hypothetical protein
MAPKKTSKKQSKSDFIRSQPATLSAAEVVAKAKTAGITFSPQLVYNVRNGSKAQKGTAKRTAKAKPTTTSKRATAPRQAPPVPRPITSTRSAADLLKAVAAEIGLGRAIEQLQGERARVRAILRG